MKPFLLILFLGLTVPAPAQTADSTRTIPPPNSLVKPRADWLHPAQPDSVQKVSAAGKSRISGSLLEGIGNKPVEFATVALYSPGSNIPIGGTTTDERGHFTLNNIAPGTYRVVASFMGFESKSLDNVVVTISVPELLLGTIAMRTDNRTLNEVVVTAEKSLIEDKDDRLVYNAAKDLTNTGGNALDVLKKVPMLTVDPDGTVQLKGSSSIKVLVNGKPSSIMARSLSEALQLIPAELIKSVEVITAPSAKYDSEGTAGVINIITKSQLQGITGGLNGTLGTRRDNLGGNVNMKRDRLSVSGFGGVNWYNSFGSSENVRQNFRNEQLVSIIAQNNNFSNHGRGLFGSFSVDYDLDSTNRVGMDLNLGGDNRSNFSTRDTRQSVDMEKAFRRNTDSPGNNNNMDVNVNYNKTFKGRPDQEFTFLAQYNQTTNQSSYTLNQYPLPDLAVVNYRERNNNQNRQNETTLQADYVHSFSTVKRRIVEIGSKLIRRDVGSNYRLDNSPDGVSEFREDPRRANIFAYEQSVWASYATFRMRTQNKWGFNVGGRFERTMINADFQSTDTRFANQYNTFLPNVGLSKRLKNEQRIRLNYSQRIQRPQINFLNPYINSSDPKNLQSGNPYLNPELAYSVELSYSTFTKNGTTVNLLLFGRQTNNAIERITTVDSSGVSFSTFRNIARNATYGTTLFGSVKPAKKWNLSGSVTVNYNSLNSPALQISNRNVSYQLTINTSLQLPHDFSLQANGSYNSRRIQLQGQSSGFYYYGFSGRKEFKPKNITITATIENPFRLYNVVSNQFRTSTFISDGVNYNVIRNIRVSAGWRFGKMTAGNQNREKKKVNNDDKRGE